MAIIRERPVFVDKKHKFCAGCGHGILNRLLAEVLEERGLLDRNVIVLGVGCSCNMSAYWGGDVLQAAHGRASSIARGLKTAAPDTLVMSYQGDGDAYVIGLSDTLNLAYVNANVLIIVVNNNNFAMTGGQMSWTTLDGQKTTTSSKGRDVHETGLPMKVPEMIVHSFKDVAFVARASTHDAANINMLKRYIREGVDAQLAGEGFCLIDVLSQCPVNWGMSLADSLEWMKNSVVSYFPLGVLKGRAK